MARSSQVPHQHSTVEERYPGVSSVLLTESRDSCVAKRAPTLETRRKWCPAEATHKAKSVLKHQEIISQCKEQEKVLVLEKVNHPVTRHLQLSDMGSWYRRYTEKSRLQDAQRLSPKESKDNRCAWKMSRSESSLGRRYAPWRLLEPASSSKPHMTSYHHHRTSTNGTEKTLHLQQI